MPISNIYYPDFLCKEFRNSGYPMPDNIRKGRNLSIIVGYIEIACCFASFLLYERLRSRIILYMIILTFIATLSGFFAKLSLDYWGLLLHATYSISVVGGFYLYLAISYAITYSR